MTMAVFLPPCHSSNDTNSETDTGMDIGMDAGIGMDSMTTPTTKEDTNRTTTTATTTTTTDAGAATTTTTATATDAGTPTLKLPIRMISTVVRGFGRGSTELGIPTANLSRNSSDSNEKGVEQPGQPRPPQPFRCQTSFDSLPTGIYWGFARILPSSTTTTTTTGTSTGTSSVEEEKAEENAVVVYTTACSIGYNPTYGNDEKTIEPHLIAPKTIAANGHNDPRRHASPCGESVLGDFYDRPIRLSIVGYLRPELPFEGVDKLVQAIKGDIQTAERLGEGTQEGTLQEKAWVAASTDEL